MSARRFLKALTIIGGLAFALLASLAPNQRPAEATPGLNPVPCPSGVVYTPGDPSFQALPGARAYFGSYVGGLYQFEVPDNWNGELILYQHGTGSGTVLEVDMPGALRKYATSNGFAIGASSYRCYGSYLPGVGLSDTVLLKDLFSEKTGKSKPSRTYLTGTSQGGFQTQLAMHVFPTMFDGALAMCGMNSANWDYYVAIGAAAEYITGIRFNNPAKYRRDSG